MNSLLRTGFLVWCLVAFCVLLPTQSHSETAQETGRTSTVRNYLNPHTGRFWTMDSYEGNSSDPESLHKYLYCQADSVNRLDPSGQSGEFSAGVMVNTLNMSSYLQAYDLSIVQQNAYVTLQTRLVGQTIYRDVSLLSAESLEVGTSALELGAGVMGRVAFRLLHNTTSIPLGNFSYGKMLEQLALQSEQGYLGGNVSRIDFFKDGLAISFRSHGLSASFPNLESRLLQSIENDLKYVSQVKTTGAQGRNWNNDPVKIKGADIEEQMLIVSVPQSQAGIILNSSFRSQMMILERIYDTRVMVVPVNGWML